MGGSLSLRSRREDGCLSAEAASMCSFRYIDDVQPGDRLEFRWGNAVARRCGTVTHNDVWARRVQVAPDDEEGIAVKKGKVKKKNQALRRYGFSTRVNFAYEDCGHGAAFGPRCTSMMPVH